jgi:DNA polymerase-3 subunit delta
MNIKQSMLTQQVQKKLAPLYVLIGQDHYLLEESLGTIKSAIKKNEVAYEEQIINIQSAEDWNRVKEEANSYSLFSNTVVLTVFFDKKSIDATGKKVLTEYLSSINPRCFIIIQAPNVPAKQIPWLSSQEHAVLILIYPLNPESMLQWINNQLKKSKLSFDPQVASLIYQYTQGNMLACAQAIEKITLSSTPGLAITKEQAQEQLSNQCEHDLFELIDTCLLAQADKAIQIIRQTASTEATLILWILSQEIRLMMQLIYLLEQGIEIKEACSQLKIWPQRIRLYQIGTQRLNKSLLNQLHRSCYALDEAIKSNTTLPIRDTLEHIALSLCLGEVPCKV